MDISQVGIQLFSLRDYAKNPADLAKTLRRVREIGYKAVQVSGICQIDECELYKMLSGEGLVCAATHEPGDMILNEPQAVVERLEKLDCKYTAYPFPAGIDMTNLKSVLDFTDKLNNAGKVLYDSGKVLCYHNHSHEFKKIEGELVLDLIYDKTDRKYLQGEIDTYWVQYGGGSPVMWCEKLSERLPILHLKDYKINSENKPIFAEIGYGNLDWMGIITAAEEAGCRWYFVEQDTCEGDPFESIKKSFDFIKENLCI